MVLNSELTQVADDRDSSHETQAELEVSKGLPHGTEANDSKDPSHETKAELETSKGLPQETEAKDPKDFKEQSLEAKADNSKGLIETEPSKIQHLANNEPKNPSQ